MFIICRSPKGGVGTSVVAAALALRHAHAGHPTVLVDLAGDQPDLLGVAPSSSLGIGDWAAVGDDVPVEALTALEVEVGGGLSLLPSSRRRSHPLTVRRMRRSCGPAVTTSSVCRRRRRGRDGAASLVVRFEGPTCPSTISPSTPRRRCAWSGDGPTRRRGDWSSPGGPGGSGHGICWGIAFQHPPQQCDRSGFVERIVAVATFRGLHA